MSIEAFIEKLPEHGLAYADPWSGKAVKWHGDTYPTVTNKDGSVKILLSRTDIYEHKGYVRFGNGPAGPTKGFIINGIITIPEKRNQGLASQMLKEICAVADETGTGLKLEVAPMAGFTEKQKHLTFKQLHDWYARHGFSDDGCSQIMVRNWSRE